MEQGNSNDKEDILRLGSPREHPKAKDWIKEYVKDHVVLYIDDISIEYYFIGYRVDIDETWIYLEADSLYSIPSLGVQSTLLTETFIGQENHIQFHYNNKVYDGVCTYDRPIIRVYPIEVSDDSIIEDDDIQVQFVVNKQGMVEQDDSIIEDDDIQIDEFSMGSALDLPEPPVAEVDEEEEIFIVVEQQAKPRKGEMKALQRSVKYTELATRNNIEGRIIVQFVVNKQGMVEQIEILRGLPGGLNEEVIRVLKESRWIPARQRGKPVSQKMSMPFVFQFAEVDEEEEIFIVVEQQAKPRKGGMKALQRSVKYTELATRNNIEGRIIVQFVVNKQGMVEQIEILRGLPGGLNEEVIRVLKESRWIPARQRGKPVSQKMSMPFVFQLKY